MYLEKFKVVHPCEQLCLCHCLDLLFLPKPLCQVGPTTFTRWERERLLDSLPPLVFTQIAHSLVIIIPFSFVFFQPVANMLLVRTFLRAARVSKYIIYIITIIL